MKIYCVIRRNDGSVCCWVQHNAVSGNGYPLPHVAAHSPTGFETGYGGSGPADLALSILADYFGEAPGAVLREWLGPLGNGAKRSRALALHQSFKLHVIATQQIGAGEHYDIDEQTIREWLDTEEEIGESGWADTIAGGLALILAMLPWLLL